MNDWKIFTGNSEPHDNWKLPEPPNWRPFGQDITSGESRREIRGETFQAREEEIQMVNAALYLRRPLLVTGRPGTGKSSLAYAVAKELKLGEVLYWPITTRTTLKDGLYNYDAIARLQRLQEEKEQQPPNFSQLSPDERKKRFKEQLRSIENYITLGPLGTALLPSDKPRVLLIDEIDKSDIDLPNDLLTIFEEGSFKIPELVRIKKEVKTASVRTAYTADISADISEGRIFCTAFPFVLLTSNGERDFPPPFLRRCLRLTMKEPEKPHLVKIIAAQLGKEIGIAENSEKLTDQDLDALVDQFIENRKTETLANDQLLNALFMVTKGRVSTKDGLIKQLLKDLGQTEEDE
ncbi:MoxR family ATPase [Limnoraphis robusta Tam1]|uniref:AAA family ATPase n=1 Tax=Limnoraphis robusta TaxID=1118279 RepID=UPI002B1FC52B|nr:MoxR family ATPase [Limnoraphis robusta]MEA5499181.1 MoxR family ATPase [Limnoraphis robusta BA-68 BA1]MEA5540698.1 MoxR family ATPase [Limnoraphis robusta Tam1]